MVNRVSAWGRLSGRRTRAFKTLKTTALAPMPRARVAMAVMTKPGDLANWRKIYLTSLRMMLGCTHRREKGSHNRSISCVRSDRRARQPSRLLNGPGLPADLYALTRIYYSGYIRKRGNSIRNHCGAQPPRHTEPPGLVRAV